MKRKKETIIVNELGFNELDIHIEAMFEEVDVNKGKEKFEGFYVKSLKGTSSIDTIVVDLRKEEGEDHG